MRAMVDIEPNNPFSKTICSICYEDLKPITEDLQSISVCGHVFHELCLQQWFEYCPKGKKKNCPICKQNCTDSNVCRLYFQSVGDSNESQKPRDCNEEVPENLRNEIKRLEGKANALSSTLELQLRELKQVNHQLVMSKEQLAIEVRLKNDALTQKAAIKQLLHVKSEELEKSTLERTRAQERCMALAKELAALKLASDLNLDEEDVMKLASLGHDNGSKETADILKKSLIIRNKCYKELMAKCNTLGRGEARSLRKLEKANEEINKLKSRVQELEIDVEKKDNEALKVLKNQYLTQRNTLKRSADQADFVTATEMPDYSFCSKNTQPINLTNQRKMTDNITLSSSYDQRDKEKIPLFVNVDDDILLNSAQVSRFTSEKSMPCTNNSAVAKDSHVQNEIRMPRACSQNDMSCSGDLTKCDGASEPPIDIDDEIMCYGDTNEVKSVFSNTNETGSSFPFNKPVTGGQCFSGGLLGPDGTNRHLGKWCKKVQSSGTGDLIAVGADGRGGKIKVMRSLEQSSTDIKSTSVAKKCKTGVKSFGVQQQQGHLQIDHFFQKKG